MEMPIHPPESPRTVPFSTVKQEEEEEPPIQRDPRRVPKQMAVQEECVQGEGQQKHIQSLDV